MIIFISCAGKYYPLRFRSALSGEDTHSHWRKWHQTLQSLSIIKNPIDLVFLFKGGTKTKQSKRGGILLKVSVIITNYNLEKYLGRCLRSCLNQTLPHEQYEIIVVDDCSTDNSMEVLVPFKETTNVKIIALNENQGVSNASNVGIRRAQAPYVMRVDADDYINQNMLYFFSEILNWNPDVSFVYGDIYKVDEYGNHIERLRLNILENLFNHGAGIMFRKSCLEAVGLYDKELRNCEDFDLLKRIFKNFDGYYLRLPFYRYRRHEHNMTNNVSERKKWENIVMNKYKEEGS